MSQKSRSSSNGSGASLADNGSLAAAAAAAATTSVMISKAASNSRSSRTDSSRRPKDVLEAAAAAGVTNVTATSGSRSGRSGGISQAGVAAMRSSSGISEIEAAPEALPTAAAAGLTSSSSSLRRSSSGTGPAVAAAVAAWSGRREPSSAGAAVAAAVASKGGSAPSSGVLATVEAAAARASQGGLGLASAGGAGISARPAAGAAADRAHRTSKPAVVGAAAAAAAASMARSRSPLPQQRSSVSTPGSAAAAGRLQRAASSEITPEVTAPPPALSAAPAAAAVASTVLTRATSAAVGAAAGAVSGSAGGGLLGRRPSGGGAAAGGVLRQPSSGVTGIAVAMLPRQSSAGRAVSGGGALRDTAGVDTSGRRLSGGGGSIGGAAPKDNTTTSSSSSSGSRSKVGQQALFANAAFAFASFREKRPEDVTAEDVTPVVSLLHHSDEVMVLQAAQSIDRVFKAGNVAAIAQSNAICSFITLLASDESSKVAIGLNALDVLSYNPQLQQMINEQPKVLPLLLQLLSHRDVTLVCGASSTLWGLAAERADVKQAIVDHAGTLPKLVILLQNQLVGVVEAGLGLICCMAYDLSYCAVVVAEFPGTLAALFRVLARREEQLVTKAAMVLSRLAEDKHCALLICHTPGGLALLAQLLQPVEAEVMGDYDQGSAAAVASRRRRPRTMISTAIDVLRVLAKDGRAAAMVAQATDLITNLVGLMLKGEEGDVSRTAAGLLVDLAYHPQAAVIIAAVPEAAKGFMLLARSADAGIHRMGTLGITLLAAADPAVAKQAALKREVFENWVVRMYHTDPRLVCAAASALQNLGKGGGADSKMRIVREPAAMARSVQLLHHEDPQVVRQALGLIASVVKESGLMGRVFFEETGAFNMMISLMGHGDQEVASAACGLVLPVLTEQPEVLRAAAAEPGTLRNMVSLLYHKDVSQALAAARALGELSHQSWSMQLQVGARV